MRILNSVLGDATGGRWKVVCDYARLLNGHGHRVRLLLDERHRPDLDTLPSGIEVEWIRNRGHYDFPAAWSLRRRLADFRPQLAIAHCSRSVAVLKRALRGAAPVVAVTHSTKVRRLLPADAFLPLSAAIERRLQEADPRVADRPCYRVPNMIALEADAALPPRPRNRPPRIAALGRFDAVKGLDVFIEALALLRERGYPFQGVLAGDGKERESLRRLAADRGPEGWLQFPGWVPDVEDFLAGVDLLCIPARSDAFGLTPLQAAAAGVPMVLSRASGHREMFAEEREALFCEVGDPRSTAQQMARLLDDGTRMERQRAAAFERVRRCYSASLVSERILQALENIANYYNK
ncbi:MAG TPA: glycosyltransferase family 1 protein [Gammaproteobacteria bacterium]|nr:glycosyltransferase family 1 protein [Gammaproteobacteria bacterium]